MSSVLCITCEHIGLSGNCSNVKDGHGALDPRFPILYLHMTRQDPVHSLTSVLTSSDHLGDYFCSHSLAQCRPLASINLSR